MNPSLLNQPVDPIDEYCTRIIEAAMNELVEDGIRKFYALTNEFEPNGN